jgi:hypothetical protein
VEKTHHHESDDENEAEKLKKQIAEERLKLREDRKV